MKILQYIPTASFFLGGGEVVPINQAIFLSKLGHEVTIVVVKSIFKEKLLSEYRLEKYDKIRVVEFEVSGDYYRHVNTLQSNHREFQLIYLYLNRLLAKYLSENKYDWVFTHYPPAVFGVPKGQKLLHFLHGVPPNWDVICDSSLRIADQLIAVSNSVCEGWKEKFSFGGKIEVLNNGIDIDFFKPSNKVDRKNLLFVGRLIEIKGLQYLIPAFRKILDQNRGLIELNIVGEGPYKEEVISLIKLYKLEQNVNLMGHVSKSDLLALYQSSLCAIFPSYEREGVLTTLLESASSGCPIITCDCCGMVDFAIHEYNSLLCKPKSVNDIQKNISRLIQDNKLRNNISINARKDVESNWSWHQYCENLIKLIS